MENQQITETVKNVDDQIELIKLIITFIVILFFYLFFGCFAGFTFIGLTQILEQNISKHIFKYYFSITTALYQNKNITVAVAGNKTTVGCNNYQMIYINNSPEFTAKFEYIFWNNLPYMQKIYCLLEYFKDEKLEIQLHNQKTQFHKYIIEIIDKQQKSAIKLYELLKENIKRDDNYIIDKISTLNAFYDLLEKIDKKEIYYSHNPEYDISSLISKIKYTTTDENKLKYLRRTIELIKESIISEIDVSEINKVLDRE